MDFGHSARTLDLLGRVSTFVETEIRPREPGYVEELKAAAEPWTVPPVVEELKAAARDAGLWNLYMHDTAYGPGLSNTEYAPLAEAMGSSRLAPEVFNCNAPDSGNAEILAAYGTDDQKKRWLEPLLAGEFRSAFCMTEPGVASSDATTMEATARLEGDEVVLDGRKWWSTGVGHPSCRFVIFMGVTDPDAHRYLRHSMVVVPIDAPGVKVERMLTVMGYRDEPYGHGEVSFTGVRLPADAILGGPGQAFTIAQSRLGPGRVHHCMRLIGIAEKALEAACRRAGERVAFGKPLVNLGGNRERIAEARIEIDQARLLVQRTAWLLDTVGLAGALSEVSQIKAVVPRMTQRVLDMTMQLYGGAGLSGDFPFAEGWAAARALRLADGPDEVHLGVVARVELAKYRA